MINRFFKLACLAGLVVTVALVPSATNAQDEIGPKVGSTIEDFSLVDQSGKTHQFSELLKAGPVAVVFYRSASW